MKTRLRATRYSRQRSRTTARRIANLRLQGVAAALGAVARAHGPGLAHIVLDSLDVSVADLKAAGADPNDLEPLKKR